MTTNCRALCAELLGELQALRRAVADELGCPSPEPSVVQRARAAMSQPEPAPTDEELTLVYAYAVAAAVGNKRGPFKPEDAEAAQLAGLRAVLARWGAPANNTRGTH